MNIQKLEIFTTSLAKAAGELIMSHYGKLRYINKKSSAIDLVTEADLESEKLIIDSIKSSYPKHNIITEESNLINKDSDFCWIIDPLDGTTNFVHKLPIFAVSIGLKYKDQTILGVVYNPVYKQCFRARKDSGAFLNDLNIKVSSTQDLKESLLATGFPYSHDEMYKTSFRIFEEFYSSTQGIRRLGAAALDLCFVAMGRFDGFYEFNLQPWDICAGELILNEAGGRTSDWDCSTPMPPSGSRVLASNGSLHEKMSQILMKKKYSKIFFTDS